MFSLWRNKSALTIRSKLVRKLTTLLLTAQWAITLWSGCLRCHGNPIQLWSCSHLTGCSFPGHDLKGYLVQPHWLERATSDNLIGKEEYTHLGSQIHTHSLTENVRGDNRVVKRADSGTRDNHAQSLTWTVTSQVTLLSLSFPTYKMHILKYSCLLMRQGRQKKSLASG